MAFLSKGGFYGIYVSVVKLCVSYAGGLTRACFWSSFLLLRIRLVRYFLSFSCMAFIKLSIVRFGTFRFLSFITVFMNA